MAIISSQIIARDQTEISSKLNEALRFFPDPTSEYSVNIAPFGTNLFAIVVTMNVVGGLRTFIQKPFLGMKATVTCKLKRKQFIPKLGLSASVGVIKTEHRALAPLAGLKTAVSRQHNTNRSANPKEGLKTALTYGTKKSISPKEGILSVVKLGKTFIRSNAFRLGLKVTMVGKLNGVTI